MIENLIMFLNLDENLITALVKGLDPVIVQENNKSLVFVKGSVCGNLLGYYTQIECKSS